MAAKNVKCEICGAEGEEILVWTKNRYGKRYYYRKVRHGNLIHYVPVNRKPNMKKNFLRNVIMDILSGESFKLRIFTIKDMRERLKYEELDENKLNYQNLRNSLQSLVSEGFIESKTIYGKKIFINKIPELKNRYQIEKLKVDLRDGIGDGTMSYHKFSYLIRNPTEATFYYFIIMLYGDSPIRREDLKFKAGSSDGNLEINYHFIQDEPKIKKILLSFNKGIRPGEQKSIWVEYCWSDIAYEYLIGISVEIKMLNIILNSDFIRDPRCEIIDVTKSVKRTENLIRIRDSKMKLYEILLENISAGEMILLKWRKIDKKN